MRLQDLFHSNTIIAELASSDRNGVIRELVQILADTGYIGQDMVEGITKSIMVRERTRGTTGFGKGVAVPHAKIEALPRVVGAVGRSSRGVDFAALDGEPVHAIFLLLSPAERPEEHLRAMDVVFRNLQQEKFRKFLRQSDASEKIYDLLKEADEKLLLT